VNINSVVGGGVKHPDDALVIARRAQALGFTSTVGIIHDGEGQLKPLDPESLRVFYEVRKLEKSSYARLNHFQEKIAHGEPNTCAAAPDRAISISARTGWCITARSSAVFPACRSRNTPRKT